MTEAQIRETRPGGNLWRDGVIRGDAAHPGETLQQVAARMDAVLDRIRPLLNDGDVALVAHGHLQRVLTARWLGLDPSAGRLSGHPHPAPSAPLAPSTSSRSSPPGSPIAAAGPQSRLCRRYRMPSSGGGVSGQRGPTYDGSVT
jgi:hypothetical protein